jgi:hypothetical protein
MRLLRHWFILVCLLPLLVACRRTGPAATPSIGTPTPTPVYLPGAAPAGNHANAASTGCAHPLPADRKFPLPPWPDTNFCRHSVPYEEIHFGGVRKDGVPAVDRPIFQDIDQAQVWLADVEPFLALNVDNDARAYPLQLLVGHEIVNDVIAGRPVVVTYCPLGNAGLAFARTVNGQLLDFGVSGNRRHADLIMYDRQTESWRQQFTGEAIVGEMTSTFLPPLPTRIVSFADFKAQYPAGLVLFPDTGYERLYGETPYINYDSIINPRASFFAGEVDGRLPTKMRVMAVTIDEVAVAYPYSILAAERVINDTQAGADLVVFWKSGTASALYNKVIAESRDAGSAMVPRRIVVGRSLTFVATAAVFRDQETGST